MEFVLLSDLIMEGIIWPVVPLPHWLIPVVHHQVQDLVSSSGQYQELQQLQETASGS